MADPADGTATIVTVATDNSRIHARDMTPNLNRAA